MNGWKWVPVEPTQEMLSAAADVPEDWPQQHWDAMLAAAPVPPAGDVEVLPKRREQPNGFTAVGWANLRGWNEYHDAVAPLFTRLTAERDGLLAVNFDLNAGQQMMEQEIARLDADRDRLQGDKGLSEAMLKRSVMVEDFQALQSELTKARELLIDIRGANSAYALQRIDVYLSQSAPAANGERDE